MTTQPQGTSQLTFIVAGMEAILCLQMNLTVLINHCGWLPRESVQGAKLAKTVFYVAGEEGKCPYSSKIWAGFQQWYDLHHDLGGIIQ